MRSLVAGGAGFLGSHLCDRLITAGHHVVCVDNLLSGRPGNIEQFSGSDAFTYIQTDVSRPLPDLGRFDLVFHLASPASPPVYQRHPIETLRANSDGTGRLLDLATETGARFILASTSEVYGDPLEHPQAETYRGNVSSVGPRSMYDEGKRFAEALTMAYVRECVLDARIARIFNTYGPRMALDDGRLVTNLAAQALSGQPLTVYGTGEQTRSLCFVDDLVDGLVGLADRDGISGEVVNLGNPGERSVLEIASLIKDIAGSSSPVQIVPDPIGDDPQRRCPDITKARHLLGWWPRTPLRDGLSVTIDWLRGPIGAMAATETNQRSPVS